MSAGEKAGKAGSALEWWLDPFHCTQCGGIKPDDGFRQCESCRARKREYMKIYYWKGSQGKAETKKAKPAPCHCTKCGRVKPDDGFRFCAACRKSARLSQKKSRKNRHEVKKITLRACHDCGRPTPDYRCEACWEKIRGRLRETDEDFIF